MVTVETARLAELETVTDLWVSLAREQRERGSRLAAERNRSAMRAAIAAHHENEGVIVARDGERLVGFATVTREGRGLVTDADRALLSNLYVVSDRRDEGIGTVLLEAVEERCREWGVSSVTLEVLAANEDARRFYTERGYDIHRLRLERSLAESDTHTTGER